MGRPGIMLYFDIRKPIARLSDAERGKLMLAMLQYGEEGKEPDFQGELPLEIAWDFVKPKINNDADRYNDVVAKRKYAGFCSSLTKKNLEAVSYEEWLEMEEAERKQMLKGSAVTKQSPTYANTCVPTTTATANTTATAKAIPKTDTYTALSADADAESDEEEDASLKRRRLQREKNLKLSMENWERAW